MEAAILMFVLYKFYARFEKSKLERQDKKMKSGYYDGMTKKQRKQFDKDNPGIFKEMLQYFRKSKNKDEVENTVKEKASDILNPEEIVAKEKALDIPNPEENAAKVEVNENIPPAPPNALLNKDEKFNISPNELINNAKNKEFWDELKDVPKMDQKEAELLVNELALKDTGLNEEEKNIVQKNVQETFFSKKGDQVQFDVKKIKSNINKLDPNIKNSKLITNEQLRDALNEEFKQKHLNEQLTKTFEQTKETPKNVEEISKVSDSKLLSTEEEKDMQSRLNGLRKNESKKQSNDLDADLPSTQSLLESLRKDPNDNGPYADIKKTIMDNKAKKAIANKNEQNKNEQNIFKANSNLSEGIKSRGDSLFKDLNKNDNIPNQSYEKTTLNQSKENDSKAIIFPKNKNISFSQKSEINSNNNKSQESIKTKLDYSKNDSSKLAKNINSTEKDKFSSDVNKKEATNTITPVKPNQMSNSINPEQNKSEQPLDFKSLLKKFDVQRPPSLQQKQKQKQFGFDNNQNDTNDRK